MYALFLECNNWLADFWMPSWNDGIADEMSHDARYMNDDDV